MERVTWKGRIQPGMKDEYIRRHDEVWPEMTQMLNDAGIHNYTIWCAGDELFGYYEAEHGAEFAARVQAEAPVTARWNESMQGIMVMEADPRSGTGEPLRQVFYHA